MTFVRKESKLIQVKANKFGSEKESFDYQFKVASKMCKSFSKYVQSEHENFRLQIAQKVANYGEIKRDDQTRKGIPK